MTADEQKVLQYFETYGVNTDDTIFDLSEMAVAADLSPHNLSVWLMNLEDSLIMEDIVHGSYDSFDIWNNSYYNDCYEELLASFNNRSFPFM